MTEEIRTVLSDIESLLGDSDNKHDKQCNDMALNHMKIALEWQKRKIKKPPDQTIQIFVDNKPIGEPLTVER